VEWEGKIEEGLEGCEGKKGRRHPDFYVD